MLKRTPHYCECGHSQNENGFCTNYPYCPNSVNLDEIEKDEWDEDEWKERTNYPTIHVYMSDPRIKE